MHRIQIVDDPAIVREGFRRLLEARWRAEQQADAHADNPPSPQPAPVA